MQIAFKCGFCENPLVADVSMQGQKTICPVCGKHVTIPAPGSKSPEPKRKLRVPRDLAVETQPGLANPAFKKADPLPPPPPPPPPDPRHHMEIIIGWVCIIVGVLLAVLLPRAIFVYIPFFLGAFLMSMVLLINRRILHGCVLLLCILIPPPLLMRQNIWRNVSPAAAAADNASKVQKLAFDSIGNTRLVSVTEPEPPRYAQPAPPARVEQRKPARRVEAPPKPEAKPQDPFADVVNVSAEKPPAAGNVRPAKDPYSELLENQDAVPPLIPEDVLASTKLGHDDDFRWQEPSVSEYLLPGDPAPVADVPFAIYSDSGDKETYVPTGRMGNKDALQLDDSWDAEPHSGKTCIRIVYQDTADWATAVWQNPAHNWGDYPGGYNLTNAVKLTFWAKGESGGEKVEFMVGMEQAQNAVSRDSLKATSGIIKLRKEWKKHSIPIEKYDRSRLITGFLVRVEGQERPVVFFLDDIQFE